MISWDLISNFCSVSFDVKGFYCAEQIKSPPRPFSGWVGVAESSCEADCPALYSQAKSLPH